MIKVVGVKFKPTGSVHYYDGNNIYLKKGDKVLVESVRGLELGSIVYVDKEIDESELLEPLKPICSIATPDDLRKQRSNEILAEEALYECEMIIKKHQLDMKLLECDYTFDRNKLIFYFTAENRVDFRELVKELASRFRTRIELRQVGVRDSAKVLSGIGKCGYKICCSSWMGDFVPVSIKMAKDQNISLNPTKISGICGRLMCCLKYEEDTYLELSKTLPIVGDKVETAEGTALVIGVNIIKEEVRVKVINGFNKEENRYDLAEDILKFKNSEIKPAKTCKCPLKKKEKYDENRDEHLVAKAIYEGDNED